MTAKKIETWKDQLAQLEEKVQALVPDIRVATLISRSARIIAYRAVVAELEAMLVLVEVGELPAEKLLPHLVKRHEDMRVGIELELGIDAQTGKSVIPDEEPKDE